MVVLADGDLDPKVFTILRVVAGVSIFKLVRYLARESKWSIWVSTAAPSASSFRPATRSTWTAPRST